MTLRRARALRWGRRVLTVVVFTYIGYGMVADVLAGHWLLASIAVPALATVFFVNKRVNRLYIMDLDIAVRFAHALKGMPLHTALVSADDEYVFVIGRPRRGLTGVLVYGSSARMVYRVSKDATRDMMSDFSLGQVVSSLPYRKYTVFPTFGVGATYSAHRFDWDEAEKDAVAARDETKTGFIRGFRWLWFVTQTGLMTATRDELEETIELLGSVTPQEGDR